MQQILDALCAHLCLELVAVFLELGVKLIFRHDAELFQRSHAGVSDDIGFEIQHPLDVAQCHVKHQAKPTWQRLQEPDVRAGGGQVDVSHAFASHFGLGHFNTTFLANHAAMLEAFVFATQALIVFDGAKNLGTKKTIAFWLEGAVVDGLWLFDFAERP